MHKKTLAKLVIEILASDKNSWIDKIMLFTFSKQCLGEDLRKNVQDSNLSQDISNNLSGSQDFS